MKISEIVSIIKPSYKYYKVVPNNSIRNNSTHKIARAIASIYRGVGRRLKKEREKVVSFLGKSFFVGTSYSFESYEKVSYYIHVESSKVEFYFIIPELFEEVLLKRVKEVWNSVTVDEVKEIPKVKGSTMFKLFYDKEDALSLSVDRRTNNLLRSNLNIVDVLEDGDKAGIFYNFIPTQQYTWLSQYKNTIEKVENGEPVDRRKGNAIYMLKFSFLTITKLIDNLLNIFKNEDDNSNFIKDTFLPSRRKPLLPETKQKGSAVVVDSQIIVLSESDDKIRERNIARNIIQSFDTVEGDNKLIARRLNRDFCYKDYRIKGAPTNRFSDVECQNFIALAGRDILEEYSFIEKVETQETQVPKELRVGTIGIGTNTFRGSVQEAFLSDDKEYRNLTLMLIGPTRAGKSVLLQNISKDAINNGECVVVFDFIKNCELSSEVSALFDESKVLSIECNDFSNMQGLGYNEVGYSSDTFVQYDNAKRQTTQLLALVNSVNSDDVKLTAKMERFLTSAALVSFISNGSIKDVFDILQDHDVRGKFIKKVPADQRENLREYVRGLLTLDDVDREGNIIGTKLNLIVGIIDRLNKLKANTYMELMLKKDTSGNVDLSEEIQKNQMICIKMPEEMFSTDGERDVYTTYWITKLWLALQERASKVRDRSSHTKVNLIIDEIYQVNNTEKFLTDKLSRLAKFSIKPIISCHYIDQLKFMRNELRSANASYMFISGCDKNNFNEFREELKPYELEDMLNLPRYHSLNVIKYSEGYGKFITKLPKPLRLK